MLPIINNDVLFYYVFLIINSLSIEMLYFIYVVLINKSRGDEYSFQLTNEEQKIQSSKEKKRLDCAFANVARIRPWFFTVKE